MTKNELIIDNIRLKKKIQEFREKIKEARLRINDYSLNILTLDGEIRELKAQIRRINISRGRMRKIMKNLKEKVLRIIKS